MKLPNNNYFIFNKLQIILRLNMPHNRPNIHYIKRYIIYVFFSYIYWSRKICHVCAYINHFFILHNGINYSKKIPLHFILQRIKRTSWIVVSYILLITIPPPPKRVDIRTSNLLRIFFEFFLKRIVHLLILSFQSHNIVYYLFLLSGGVLFVRWYLYHFTIL